MNTIDISVVICTYNRVQLLPGILDGLLRQELDPQWFEVIVVDNNSTDATRTVVESYSNSPVHIKYCLELKQGLANARNRGWKEARGAYIAYVDDDCQVPPEWLRVAKETIGNQSPAIFGGPYFPIFSSPRPVWFKDEYGSNFMGNTARDLKENEYLSGGNLFVQRRLLEGVVEFNPEEVMSGKVVALGDETRFIRQTRKFVPDLKVYYEPKLYVRHLVQPDKMRLSKMVVRAFAEGRYAYLTLYEGKRSFSVKHAFGLVGIPVLIPFEFVLGGLFRNRHAYPYFQNYVYEHIFYRVIVWGRLYERLRQARGTG